jgi:hypothetical protein
MQELLNKRAYNAKHFDKGDGSFVAEIHSGHIHYKDGEEYRPIDWTLIFDEVKRGWGFNTHSFNPFFPEYSTEFAEFRDRFHDKDQIVRYKPIGATVKGELIDIDPDNPGFDDNPDNKGVIYRDVFGKGLDYMLYNTRSSMVKVAIINDPKAFTTDAVFEWELEFPDKEIFRVDKKEDAEEMTAKNTKTNTKDGKLVGYRLEKRDGKNLNTNKLALIGNSKLDGKEWFTYLKSFKAWDSEGNTIEIIARISFVNGKAILKKTIPLEFLQSAKGKVFTDTTTTYYPHVSDGITYYDSSTGAAWSTLVGAAGSVSDSNSINTGRRGATSTAWRFITRSRLTFDTSSITDSDTVSAATLGLYTAIKNNDSGLSFSINVYSSNFGSMTTLQTSDYQNSGTTAYASEIPYANFSTTYTVFTFNATGLAAISKTGYTQFCLRDTADASNTFPGNPGGDKIDRLWAYSSEQTGTTKDPYLSVTYSAGGTNVTVTPTVLSVVSSIIAPTITALKSVAVTASVLALSLSNPAPAVSATKAVTCQPDTIASALTINAPSVSAVKNASVSPTVLSGGLSVIQPSVSTSGNISVSPPALSLASALNEPTIAAEINATALPSALTVSASLLEPTITAIIGDVTVYPEVISRTITVNEPSIATIRSISIEPTVIGTSLSLLEPTVYFVTTFEGKQNVVKLKKRDFTLKLKKRSFVLKRK